MPEHYLQGGVKTAMTRVRDACSVRQRELVEEMLVLQERMDSLSHSLTERTEENATLKTQVPPLQIARPSELQHLPLSLRSSSLVLCQMLTLAILSQILKSFYPLKDRLPKISLKI